MSFAIIIAVDSKQGIAKNGAIPWASTPHGREDLRYFRDTTMGGVVIMGRRTYESIPVRDGVVLPGREVIVVTSKEIGGVTCAHSLDDAIHLAPSDKPIFVAGGAQLYAEAAAHSGLSRVLITYILEDHDCDLQFPIFNLLPKHGKVEVEWVNSVTRRFDVKLC